MNGEHNPAVNDIGRVAVHDYGNRRTTAVIHHRLPNHVNKNGRWRIGPSWTEETGRPHGAMMPGVHLRPAVNGVTKAYQAD